MEIAAEGVEVAGPHGPLLRATSLLAAPGQVLLVTGESDTERTALGLVLAGRLRPARGSVLLDGRPATAALREQVAVVDAPGVTEPDGCLPLREVVAEGLHLARRRSGRRAVRAWLDDRGLSPRAGERFENLPTTERTALLTDLAREPRGTRALVLDSPDRHGGTPWSWYATATRAARTGHTVVALCSPLAAEVLDLPAARIGHHDTPDSPTPHDRPGTAR